MRYLADGTGKRFPGETYTQVFVHGDLARAMAAGLTLLPESYAQGLAKQPDNLWLLTSELAHQWYGVGIASKDWPDLWLSEGVSAFLADAYLGQKFGEERFERQIEQARQSFNQLRAEGHDRPLAETGWTTRQEAGGEIPELKGVCFLYLAYRLMGDSAFWNGLRLYTRDQWGQAAASESFQRAYDAANTGNQSARKSGGAPGRKNDLKKNNPTTLDSLFDLWVYGIPNVKPKKSR
jgi:aminopeptidase N